MKVADLISKARKRKGLETYAAFAEFMGVSTATVYAWEHGGPGPSPKLLKRIAERLEIDLKTLSRVQMAEKLDEVA